MGQEGRNHPKVDLSAHPACNQRRNRVQPVLQKVEHVRQRRRGLGREQDDVGIGYIRQGTGGHGRRARMIAAVMGAEHPGAFLTDAPDSVNYRVQIAPVVRHTFRQRGPHQKAAPGEIRLLVHLPVRENARNWDAVSMG